MLWAQIICSRLSAEVEELDILQDTQAAYRKARGTLDIIYIMNTLFHNVINSGRKLYALFIDLKAAFDSICRERLWRIMEKRGISKYIIYISTPHEIGENRFYTSKGLKQGCPLSPLLFAIYISDIDNVL